MTTVAPIWISHRRRRWLVLSLAWFGMGIGFPFSFLLLDKRHPFSIQLENFEQTLLFIGIPLILIGIACLSVFLRSKRVEFYEDHVRVLTSLTGRSLEFPYSELKVGEPKGRVEFRQYSMHYKISVDYEGKNRSWDVTDRSIDKRRGSLYDFLIQKSGSKSFG